MGERRTGVDRPEILADPVYRAAVLASERASGPSPLFLGRAANFARVAGLLTTILGLTVFVAWAAGYSRLTSVDPAWPTMKVWTAMGLVILGLLLATHPADAPGWRRTMRFLGAVAVLALAASFLFEYAAGLSLGIDNVFGLDKSASSDLPGRPSAMTALNLGLLAGAALAWQRRRFGLAQVLGLTSAATAVVALNSYAFDAQRLFEIGVFESMAVHTALAVLLLAAGFLALSLRHGPLSLIVEHGAGGTLVRQVLPASLIVQFVIFVVAYQTVDHRETSPAFTYAVAVTLSMVVIALLVWYQGRALSASDVRRTGAEEALLKVRELMEARDSLTSKLAEREADLRRIIETSPDAFISIDRKGVVTSWNPAAERIFGWSRDEVLGQSLHRFIMPDYELWSKDGDFPDKLHRIEDFRGRASDVAAVRKDGTPVRVELTLWPQTDNEPNAFHAFARDITDRRMAEERLVQANADLQEFAAIAAHDLRNPLVTIRLAAEMLKESSRDQLTHEVAADWIERILGATNRGQQLINDLLEYSALTSGTTETTRIDLTRLVEDVADHVALGSVRDIDVHVEPLPIVEGDEPRLRQLFSNLLGNAAKYVPSDRRVKVDIRARTGRRLVRIEVCDNGNGVPDYDKEAIFQVFQRGSSPSPTPGTGVGLAICRKVAERHGGSLHVEDGPGGGACFVLELPRWPGAMTIGPASEAGRSINSAHAN